MQDFRAASLKSDTLQRVLSLEGILSKECGEPIILVAYSPAHRDPAIGTVRSEETNDGLTSSFALD